MSLTISIFTWLNQICYEYGVINFEIKNFSWHTVTSDKTFADTILSIWYPQGRSKFFKMYPCTLMQVPLKDNEALCCMEVDFFSFQSLTKVKKNINSI